MLMLLGNESTSQSESESRSLRHLIPSCQLQVYQFPFRSRVGGEDQNWPVLMSGAIAATDVIRAEIGRASCRERV